MSFFSALNISASGLTAQRLRMDTVAQNLANATVTRTENGGPYRRRNVVLQEVPLKSFSKTLSGQMNDLAGTSAGGVRAAEIVEDPSPLKLIYDPTHPDADQEGYVSMPNVDTSREMVDMITATRAYEANVTAISAFKAMSMKALEIAK